MNARLLSLFMVAFVMVGCASPMVKKPAANGVKKIALVSVYSNIEVYDVKTGNKKGAALAMLKQVVKGSNDISDEHVQIATHALKSFSEHLDTSQWKIVKPATIIKSPAYKSFRKEMKQDGWLSRLATASVATPPGMVYIPFESVAGEKNKVQLGQDPTQKAKDRLAKLAKELNVDAVAVAYVDLAYKRGMFSFSGTGLLSSIRGSATPSVSSAVVAVNRKGEIAIQTPHLVKGGGTRTEAEDKVPLISDGGATFSGEKGQEAIAGFAKTMDKSVETLRKQMNKELGKS